MPPPTLGVMTDSTPRRRHSPAVYRRRRLALLLVVLAVVAAIVLALWRPWEAAADPAAAPAASRSATPSADAATPAADESAPASSAVDDDETDESAQPAPTASDLAPCSASSTRVVAMTDKETYGSGEQPQLSISLTNTGDEACLINVGTATQTFTITSGADTWWRSTDCQSESSDQVVQIDPGQSVSSVAPIVWDRTRSSVDTCDADRPAASGGYFNLSVEIGGLAAQQDRQFVLQ